MNLPGLYTQFAALSKTNPLFAGGVSLYSLGVATYLLRNVPKALWTFFSQQLTTSITFNNGTWRNKALFNAFSNWHRQARGSVFSRRLSLEADTESLKNSVVLGPGYGRHFFFYNGRLFWFTKEKLPSQGSEMQKEEIVINVFGRSRVPIEGLIEQFKPKDEHLGKTLVYDTQEKGEWVLRSIIENRSLESVILPKHIKDGVTKQLDEFYSMREWFLHKGLAHKICMIFHGMPGVGKTSFIKALAAKYEADVYTLALSTVSDQTLSAYLSNVPAGSFVLIEDFDTSVAVKDREKPPEAQGVLSMEFPLTLSGILNCLDGITSLDNIAVFLTTNRLHVIDPALLRRGRADLIIELPYLSTTEIHSYVEYAYGKHIKEEFVPMPGCELQGLMLEHKLDFNGFHRDLVGRFGIAQEKAA